LAKQQKQKPKQKQQQPVKVALKRMSRIVARHYRTVLRALIASFRSNKCARPTLISTSSSRGVASADSLQTKRDLISMISGRDEREQSTRPALVNCLLLRRYLCASETRDEPKKERERIFRVEIDGGI
jgi:hypothetical protein